MIYSDLGVILLGDILEKITAKPLDVLAHHRIFAPLSMDHTLFKPGERLKALIAPTENDPWRGRLVQAEVHDENAYAMGGVSAHAGLFSNSGDLAVFCQMLLNGGVYDHHRIVKRSTLEKFIVRQDFPPGSSRALGWDTPSEGSSAGSLLASTSFGHTGFTGTSIWVDPTRQLFIILLTNRVYPTRENDAILEVRRQIADAVVRAVEEAHD
jgi:CubicO group peptidase (beta-lactamase class C family)